MKYIYCTALTLRKKENVTHFSFFLIFNQKCRCQSSKFK